MKKSVLKCAVVVMVVFAFGCENTGFNNAQKANTVEAYRHYLEKYPQGAHIASARTAIDKINFQKVQQQNSVSSYDEFIRTDSANIYIDSARYERARLFAEKYGYTVPIINGEYVEAEYEKSSILKYPDLGGMVWGINGDTMTFVFGGENWMVNNEEGFVVHIASTKIGSKERVSFRSLSAKNYPLNLNVQFDVSNLKSKQSSFREYLLKGNIEAGKQFHRLLAEKVIKSKEITAKK